MEGKLVLVDHVLYARHCAGCLKYSETIVCVIFLVLVNKEEHWLVLSKYH